MASLSRGAFDDAIAYAVRLVAMTPSDENHHALLIRLYRLTGDDAAARHQLRTCTELLARDFGVEPGPVVRAAMRERRAGGDTPTGLPSIEAVLESGKAAVSAGAVETGADLLRTAVRLADHADAADLRVTARLLLAETLIHSMGGLDEEGMATLQGADDIALAHGHRAQVAQARAELGYVDFLRGRYDRAHVWLSQAMEFADGAPLVTAKATAYLGSVESDRGRYVSALSLLDQAVTQARAAGDVRRVAYAVAMVGRVHLLRHDFDAAAARLDEAMALSQQEHWLAFVPWPQALRGEVELARGDRSAATVLLEQAFARACQLGDPCWEGIAARGLALVAAAEGDAARAFRILADARLRTNRLADPYVWLDGYILDTQCTLGRKHGHPDTPRWIHQLRRLASRTGMRELTVRSLLHGAAAGNPGDADAARLMAAGVDNPRIEALVAATSS
jgi:tetratricopeptide (TPR) repeat protein